MTYLRNAFLILLCFFALASNAQTVQLIGTSEQFILEIVKGYDSVEERGLEHEECLRIPHQPLKGRFSVYNNLSDSPENSNFPFKLLANSVVSNFT